MVDVLKVLTESEYREFSLKYGEIFEAGTGAETLKENIRTNRLRKRDKV